MIRRLALCLLPGLVLSACGSADEGTIATEDGDVDYAVTDEDGARHVELSGEQGTASVDTGKDVAPELPEGLSVYPGARIANVANVGLAETSGTLVSMESEDSPARIADWYRQQAEAAGYTVKAEVAGDALHILSGKTTDGREFGLVANGAETPTTIQLTAGRNL